MFTTVERVLRITCFSSHFERSGSEPEKLTPMFLMMALYGVHFTVPHTLGRIEHFLNYSEPCFRTALVSLRMCSMQPAS